MVLKVHCGNFWGGQIFRHVENASPKQSHNVWWALISFQEFDSCTQHHVYPALGKTSSAEEVFCRKLNAQWLWSLVMRVRKLSESQPRTQTSSRYPSYQRRLGTEYDSEGVLGEFFRQAWQVTSEIAEDGRERRWVNQVLFKVIILVKLTWKLIYSAFLTLITKRQSHSAFCIRHLAFCNYPCRIECAWPNE